MKLRMKYSTHYCLLIALHWALSLSHTHAAEPATLPSLVTGKRVEHLDQQMHQWSTRLRDDLCVGPPESNRLATTIEREVAGLPDEAKQRVRDASTIPLKLSDYPISPDLPCKITAKQGVFGAYGTDSELRELLPARPQRAADCRCRQHPIFAEGKV